MTDQVDTRLRLPALRQGICVELTCLHAQNQFTFEAHFNFYPDGRLGELFADPFKSGADLKGYLDLFCIAVSKLLQRGERIEEFWQTIDDGRPADRRNIFQAIIAGGVAEETQRIADQAAEMGLA